jgi:fused signal recognition particle receptor
MFGLGKKKSTPQDTEALSWSDRLRNGLTKTRHQLTDRLSNLLLGKKQIDDSVYQDLEMLLLQSDVGVKATRRILTDLTQRASRNELSDTQSLQALLESVLIDLLTPYEQPLSIDTEPYTILVLGVNGTGKTTTIAKMAHHFKAQGHAPLLAAGDTFRAAAIEQLQSWGNQHEIPVIAQHIGSDSASVIFDSMQAAKARQKDLLIADTAGRLHTQGTLMDELKKIKRVMGKQNEAAPHETLLVLDASMGQNALTQAQMFHAEIGLTGLVITKLDGTARGGIVFAVTESLGLPIRFIGVGESVHDLQPFSAKGYVEALFNKMQAE